MTDRDRNAELGGERLQLALPPRAPLLPPESAVISSLVAGHEHGRADPSGAIRARPFLKSSTRPSFGVDRNRRLAGRERRLTPIKCGFPDVDSMDDE
jgi:hypothetical protein